MSKCMWCGGEFKAVRKAQGFCSDKCSRAAHNNPTFRTQRLLALARDENACVVCRCGGPLDVHHIKPLALGGTHDLDNLQSLCKEHHVEAHRRLNNASN